MSPRLVARIDRGQAAEPCAVSTGSCSKVAVPCAVAAAPSEENPCLRLESGGDLFCDGLDDVFDTPASPAAACSAGRLAADRSCTTAPPGQSPRSSCVQEISVPPLPSVAQLAERLGRCRALAPAMASPKQAVDAAEPFVTDMGLVKLSVPRTTVTLRHLPRGIDVERVCFILDQLGFEFLYDAVYIAEASTDTIHEGDVLVNFLRFLHAEACVRLCTGCRFFEGQPCFAMYSKCQGSDFVAMCMSAHMRRAHCS